MRKPSRTPAAKLRRGRLSDLDALLALERDFFGADHQISRRGFRRYIVSPRSTLLVAEIQGKTTGCALVNYRKNWKAAHLYTIAVDRGFQRRGIGRALLAKSERDAIARGRKLMRLEVRADDPGTINLYRTAGYRNFGRKHRFYSGRIDALRFEKLLVGKSRHRAA